MQADDLSALARRFALDLDSSERLAAFCAILERDDAPTSVHEPQRILEDHVADALVALELRELEGAAAVVDIGTGPGVPALPLAIARRELRVAAVDSADRKAAFVARAIEELRLSNARAVHARVEAWPEGEEAFDVAVVRALAPLDVVAEYAAPLLRPGGVLIAWRGRRDPAAESAAARAAPVLGLELGEVRAVRPYPAARHRHLHLLHKIGHTPRRFPRRPGVARKRPLGAPG